MSDEPKGMKMAELRVLAGNREETLKFLRHVFTPEILESVEKDDPGRTNHYVQMVDMIITILHAMTSPDDPRGMEFQPGALPLEDTELKLILNGLVEAEIITCGEKGYRISEKGLQSVNIPKECSH